MSSTQIFFNLEEIMMNMQNMNMKKAQQGFTLIELMIVVAIIGILASIAIPAYQDYITKAKFQDVVSSASAIETAVSMCLQENAGVGTDCDTAAKIGLTALTASKEAGAWSLTGTATTVALSATATAGAGARTYVNTGSTASGASQMTWTQSGTCLTAAPAMCKQ